MKPLPRRHLATLIGAYGALALAAALVWALFISDVVSAPDYALDSELVFRLERAAAATLLMVVPGILIGRLLSGDFPRAIGSKGVDWEEERDTVVDTLDTLVDSVDKLKQAVDQQDQEGA